MVDPPMSKLKITLACGDYDRVRALKDGRVQPEGVNLNFIALEPEEIFFRMARHRDFDASEMSLASYITGRSQGREDFLAIPVFPSRMFRHSAIYVNAEAGIERPEDLKGRRVGLGEFQMTAMVWVRGILSDDYGVKASDIEWRTGGQEQPGREGQIRLDLPPEIRMEPIPAHRTLTAMLESGELEALMAARTPSCYVQGSPRVKRLFEDPMRVEEEYFRRTGIFPIMHTLVLRREVYDQHPWVAVSLFKAFQRAWELSWEGHFGPAVHSQLAWLQLYQEREEALLGRQAWAHGAEPNRTTLETLCRYLVEQGIVRETPGFEQLFSPNTLTSSKI